MRRGESPELEDPPVRRPSQQIAAGVRARTMSPKAKGSRQECRSIAVLEAAGYYCVRSHRSEGIFDLVGISSTDIVLVQVKTTNWPYGEEMEALRAFLAPPNARKLVHRWRAGCSVPDVKEV